MKSIINLSVLSVFILSMFSCQNADDAAFYTGKVKKQSIALAPKVAGRILDIKVEEADVVNKGDTLAVIDVPEVEAKILQAEGAVLSAEAQLQMALNGATSEQLDQVNAMSDAANEQFEFAKKSLERIRNMYNDSLVSPQKYDEVLTKYNMALAQLNASKAKVKEVFGGVRAEKINMAAGQLKRAKGALQEAQTAYSERFIIAPQNMSIETIALHEGELALPGYNLFTAYIPNSTYFRFTIRESNVKQFQKNKEYNISIPFDNKEIVGKLVAIKQLASYANKTTSYPDYELGESVYELKFIANSSKETNNLFNNYTAILKKGL